jgi:hypothetical protein
MIMYYHPEAVVEEQVPRPDLIFTTLSPFEALPTTVHTIGEQLHSAEFIGLTFRGARLSLDTQDLIEPRKLRVLGLTAADADRPLTSEMLYLARSTVQSYRHDLLNTLQATNMRQAITRAMIHAVIHVETPWNNVVDTFYLRQEPLRSILVELARGKEFAAIAAALPEARSTEVVSNLTEAMRLHTGMRTREGLVTYAYSSGLITLDEVMDDSTMPIQELTQS